MRWVGLNMHRDEPMSDCIWKSLGDGIWTCMKCRTPPSLRKKYHDTPPPRNCKGPQRIQRCQHLGPPTGFVECPTCNGNVRLKVFVCEIHKAATVKKPMAGLACCATCAQYVPLKDFADEAGSAAG